MGASCSRCRSTALDDDGGLPDLAPDGVGTTPNGPSATLPNGHAPGKQPTFSRAPSRTVSTAGSVYFDADEGEWHGQGGRADSAGLRDHVSEWTQCWSHRLWFCSARRHAIAGCHRATGSVLPMNCRVKSRLSMPRRSVCCTVRQQRNMSARGRTVPSAASQR